VWLDKYYLHVEKGGRRIVSNERNWCQIVERFAFVLQKSNSFTSAELGYLKKHSKRMVAFCIRIHLKNDQCCCLICKYIINSVL